MADDKPLVNDEEMTHAALAVITGEPGRFIDEYHAVAKLVLERAALIAKKRCGDASRLVNCRACDISVTLRSEAAKFEGE